jgi:drug/metabolite transporter (DMT)-like permease
VVIPANIVPCEIGYTGGIILLCIGIAAAIGQLLMTHACRFVSVSTGSLLSMLLPVVNIITGVAVFHEALSLQALAGSLIVIASCVAVLLVEKKSTDENPVH